jgi:hypothetical protein
VFFEVHEPTDAVLQSVLHKVITCMETLLTRRLHCRNCGGELKLIAAILEAPVIEKMLTCLGLQARAPPRAPARGQGLKAAWAKSINVDRVARRHGSRGLRFTDGLPRSAIGKVPRRELRDTWR